MGSRIVRVVNTSRGTALAERCRVASGLADRARGLLGRRGLAAGEGLYVERAPSIHMFFMRFAIDAVFVDAGGRVVRVVDNLRPWRIVAWVRGASDCVELPAGSVQLTGTQVGDVLALEPIDPPQLPNETRA
ncbi:MAG: DUF192 domain-containing protein [Candidatus Limnocylindria bacterium]